MSMGSRYGVQILVKKRRKSSSFWHIVYILHVL